ncbi:MAG: hypothetical protein AAFN77_23250 [Planctomycetota bacterium]
MPNQKSKQSIEELQQRYDEFKAQKVKFETQRDAAIEELDNLKQQARELYGSDDIEALEKMLKEMKAENEKKRSQYQASLDEIDSKLQAVQAEFEVE